MSTSIITPDAVGILYILVTTVAPVVVWAVFAHRQDVAAWPRAGGAGASRQYRIATIAGPRLRTALALGIYALLAWSLAMALGAGRQERTEAAHELTVIGALQSTMRAHGVDDPLGILSCAVLTFSCWSLLSLCRSLRETLQDAARRVVTMSPIGTENARSLAWHAKFATWWLVALRRWMRAVSGADAAPEDARKLSQAEESRSTNWQEIGTVTTLSGQVLLADPNLLHQAWTKRDFEDVRRYRHRTTGEELVVRIGPGCWDTVVEPYGVTMGSLIETDACERLAVEIPPELSYHACCMAASSSAGHGSLFGYAAAIRTLDTAGSYPVHVRRNGAGEITHVLLDLLDPRLIDGLVAEDSTVVAGKADGGANDGTLCLDVRCSDKDVNPPSSCRIDLTEALAGLVRHMQSIVVSNGLQSATRLDGRADWRWEAGSADCVKPMVDDVELVVTRHEFYWRAWIARTDIVVETSRSKIACLPSSLAEQMATRLSACEDFSPLARARNTALLGLKPGQREAVVDIQVVDPISQQINSDHASTEKATLNLFNGSVTIHSSSSYRPLLNLAGLGVTLILNGYVCRAPLLEHSLPDRTWGRAAENHLRDHGYAARLDLKALEVVGHMSDIAGMMTFDFDLDGDDSCLAGKELAPLELRSLHKGTVLACIVPEKPWTSSSIRRASGDHWLDIRWGADAYLGGKWIGSTEA